MESRGKGSFGLPNGVPRRGPDRRRAHDRGTAAALSVRPKTVETNLGRIYRKLGMRSRIELARRWPHLSSVASKLSRARPAGFTPEQPPVRKAIHARSVATWRMEAISSGCAVTARRSVTSFAATSSPAVASPGAKAWLL